MAPLLYACILLPLTAGLIGFDCGGHGLNITILSLLDISELEEIETSTEETYVQLLQLSDYDRVQQCKMKVDRTIFCCGMHSHIFAVQNGHKVYLQILSNTACQQLHETDHSTRERDHFRSVTK